MKNIIKIVLFVVVLLSVSSCDKEENTDVRILKTYVTAASNYHVEDGEQLCSVLNSSEELAQFLASREIDESNPIYDEVKHNDFSQSNYVVFFSNLDGLVLDNKIGYTSGKALVLYETTKFFPAKPLPRYYFVKIAPSVNPTYKVTIEFP